MRSLRGPDWTLPDLTVGQALRRFLRAQGMSQKDLAEAIGMSEKNLSGLILGRVGVSPASAVVLEASTGVRAGVWAAMFVEDAARQLRCRPEVQQRVWEIQRHMAILGDSPPPEPRHRGRPRKRR